MVFQIIFTELRYVYIFLFYWAVNQEEKINIDMPQQSFRHYLLNIFIVKKQ